MFAYCRKANVHRRAHRWELINLLSELFIVDPSLGYHLQHSDWPNVFVFINKNASVSPVAGFSLWGFKSHYKGSKKGENNIQSKGKVTIKLSSLTNEPTDSTLGFSTLRFINQLKKIRWVCCVRWWRYLAGTASRLTKIVFLKQVIEKIKST